MLGKFLGRAWAEDQLAQLNLRAALSGLAHLLARRQSLDTSPQQADDEVLRACVPGLASALRRA